MLPAMRVTGGSVHFAGAGWVELDALNGGAGGNAAGNVMLTNSGTDVVYFAFSDNADGATPGLDPGPGNGNLTVPITGNIPVGAGDSIIVAQPDSAAWWGVGGTVTSFDVTPVEVINT